MATLHRDGGDGRVVYLKGASEAVLERCASALDEDGRPAPADRDALLLQSASLAARGLRVLALARGTAPAGAAHIDLPDVASGLTFLGFAGMIDPPRPEVIEAVARCQQAGVRVKMITGDHPLTASAIAQQIGLKGASGADGLAAMTGLELASVQDRDLLDVADRTAVFARVSPEQKLRLVEALQARGHIVAMTGDGVNDAPALKQADIGVAMGVTGTDVAKEAADMLLTDDNFATIEAAVEEGRGVFDNLTKFITWTLPTNLGEGLVILAAIFAGVDAADPAGADPLDQHDHRRAARPDAGVRAEGARAHGPPAPEPDDADSDARAPRPHRHGVDPAVWPAPSGSSGGSWRRARQRRRRGRSR